MSTCSTSPRGCVIAPLLLEYIRARVERGEQSSLLLNWRRGLRPGAALRRLRLEKPVPAPQLRFRSSRSTAACVATTAAWPRQICRARLPRDAAMPTSGTIGRGTERLEEHLANCWWTCAALPAPRFLDGAGAHYPHRRRHHACPGALRASWPPCMPGMWTVLVGTQMVAKGHDFRRVTLVAAINPTVPCSPATTAPLSACLPCSMRAGGRARRDPALRAHSGSRSRPSRSTTPCLPPLRARGYPAFAQTQLREREQTALPPFTAQALVRAEGPVPSRGARPS